MSTRPPVNGNERRGALRVEVAAGKPSVATRACGECGTPLPKDAPKRQIYCDKACRDGRHSAHPDRCRHIWETADGFTICFLCGNCPKTLTA